MIEGEAANGVVRRSAIAAFAGHRRRVGRGNHRPKAGASRMCREAGLAGQVAQIEPMGREMLYVVENRSRLHPPARAGLVGEASDRLARDVSASRRRTRLSSTHGTGKLDCRRAGAARRIDFQILVDVTGRAASGPLRLGDGCSNEQDGQKCLSHSAPRTTASPMSAPIAAIACITRRTRCSPSNRRGSPARRPARSTWC